jgi:hypothetical protein
MATNQQPGAKPGNGSTAQAQGKPGRKKMTEAEKAAQKEKLKNETAADRFRRVAKVRVPKAVSSIKACALTARGYEFTAEQRDKIVATLESAVNDVKAAMSGGGKAKAEFDI